MFEVTIALGISALIIVVLVSLVTNSIRNSIYSRNKSLAAKYAQEATEWLRGQRDFDTATFIIKAGNLSASPGGCFNSLPAALALWPAASLTCPTNITGTPFARQIMFTITTEPEGTLIEADVTVSWKDSQGTHKVTSATIFSNWNQP